jgi:hypothetical protein
MSESKRQKLLTVSDPSRVRRNLNKYLGPEIDLWVSDRKHKKYCVVHPTTLQKTHFGDIRYSDFTKHRDRDRQQNYLARASAIKGAWRANRYSPNQLSINLLWQ